LLISYKINYMIRKFASFLFFISTVLLLTVTSCDPTAKYEREEESRIQDYLKSNLTLAFQKKASGLYYLEVQAGQGRLAVTHDTAYVKYTGKFLDGTVFDTNIGITDTLFFPVNEETLISGFDEGITYMNEGGKAMFLIPSFLGYGNSGYYMPSYTPILFDVELVKLKPGQGK